MSARLDNLIGSARDLDASWDVDRSERVRESALRRRDTRVRRDRALRRGLVVASGAGLLVLALLRAASSAPSQAAAEPITTAASPSSAPTAEALASRTVGFADAGYARD